MGMPYTMNPHLSRGLLVEAAQLVLRENWSTNARRLLGTRDPAALNYAEKSLGVACVTAQAEPDGAGDRI